MLLLTKGLCLFRWYVLEREGGRGPFLGRIHLRLCFDGGYHVMDESSNYISDTRPTARQLWRPPLGVLEVGIHGANNLLPMKTTKDNRGSTDAYCVAKYGLKWIRTRTIFDSFNPRWNEQYTWEVYDPCTVVTIGVFDNRYPFLLHPFPSCNTFNSPRSNVIRALFCAGTLFLRLRTKC